MFLRDLLTYARILRKRWWLIAALFVTTVGTTMFLSVRAKPFYCAWVKLQVSAPPPTDVSLYSGFRYDDFRAEVAYTRIAFVELLGDLGLVWTVISKVGATMEAEDLLERTTIEDGSNFINVGVTADTPEEAQALVTTLVEETLNYYGSLQARPTTAAREFISRELEAVREELAEAERTLTQFKIENKIGQLKDDIYQQQNLMRALLLSRDQALAQGETEEAARYDQIIAQRQMQLQGLVSLSTEYESLATAVDLARGTYNLLLSKETEAKIKENQILNGRFIQIISPARLPKNAISSFNPKIILLSGVVSLVIGVMLAFVWNYAETQLGDVEQVAPARVIPMGKPAQ